MAAGISYVRDSDAISTQVGDNLIALQSQTWTYADFAGTGSRIWESLATPRTIPALVEQLRDEFDVDADQCARDTEDFVEMLVSRQFVRATGA